MSQRRNAKALLRQASIFAVGTLIGSTIATPVLAAPLIAIDGFSKPVLFGSVVLLVIGLVLKAKFGKTAPRRATRAPSTTGSADTGRNSGAATRTSAAAGVPCDWPRVVARDARRG